MSILVFIEHDQHHLHPQAWQALNFGVKTAALLGQELYALSINPSQSVLQQISSSGVKKVFLTNEEIEWSDSLQVLSFFEPAMQQSQAKMLLMMMNDISKIVAPQLSAVLGASLTMGVTSLPQLDGEKMILQRSIFSGKASQTLSLLSSLKIITLQPNSFEGLALKESQQPLETIPVSFDKNSHVTMTHIEEKEQGHISLTDAEIVVSGGMGMGASTNWHLLEQLAQKMNAALACTRLVADAEWRPHHEHVGQTGTTIAPQLYIAVGISGAIQHVAGINQSKIIVAINKDKQAPIFSIADYGIEGDALEILPKLLE